MGRSFAEPSPVMPAAPGRSPCAAMRITVYYGHRRFLLLAPSYVLDRSHDPYRRLSVTLLVACGEPFQLEWNEGECIRSQVALLAPKVSRRRLVALRSKLLVFDFPMPSPECSVLQRVLGAAQVVTPPLDRLVPLLPDLERLFARPPAVEAVRPLFAAVATALSGSPLETQPLDVRVDRAMRLIDDLPLGEVALDALAQRLHLSASRLRHLFKEQTGSTVRQYARWAAVWRAALLWTQGRPLTAIAHEVGFYDLAHLDHAFTEVFGMNPSSITDPRNVTLIRGL